MEHILALTLVTGYLCLFIVTLFSIPLMRKHPEILFWLSILFLELFADELLGTNDIVFSYRFKYDIIAPSVWVMVFLVARVIYKNWPPKS